MIGRKTDSSHLCDCPNSGNASLVQALLALASSQGKAQEPLWIVSPKTGLLDSFLTYMRSTLEERLHCKSQRKEDFYCGRSNYPWIRWIRPDGALFEPEAHRSPGSTPAGPAAFPRERILSR